ncbi:MAG: DUF3108 domain-containing protein [bacterium]
MSGSIRLAVACCLGALMVAGPGKGHTADDDGAVGGAFAVGERFTYSIRYGFAKAGEATMEVKEIVDCGGAKCYRVISEARSTMPFSLFFEVRDSVSSLIDVERLYSHRYEKNLKEGHYSKNEVVVFDQVNHTAIYPDSSVVEIPPEVHDVLTSLYFIRTVPLEVGTSVLIQNHADRKNYPLEVKVVRTERVSVPAGDFDCLVVQPILKASGLFQHQGRLTVWFTNDRRRVPVKMSGKIVVGTIDAVLSDVREGN